MTPSEPAMVEEDVSQQVTAALAPLVGTVLAGVTVQVEATRLGKSTATLDYADLGELSTSIERHLVSFVGPKVAQAAATRVRELSPFGLF